MTNSRDIKNKNMVAIPLGFIYKIPSSNEQMLYTLVSLIMYGGDYLDCRHYFGNVFDINTGIWWHCDD